MSKHYYSPFPSSPAKKRRVETTSTALTDKDTLTTLKERMKKAEHAKNEAYFRFNKALDEYKVLKKQFQSMCPHEDYEREPTYDHHGPSFYYRCKACDKYK